MSWGSSRKRPMKKKVAKGEPMHILWNFLKWETRRPRLTYLITANTVSIK